MSQHDTVSPSTGYLLQRCLFIKIVPVFMKCNRSCAKAFSMNVIIKDSTVEPFVKGKNKVK